MVKPQRGDTGGQRLRYDIRAVIFTANSDFQYRHIDLVIIFEFKWSWAEDDAHLEGKENVIGQ